MIVARCAALRATVQIARGSIQCVILQSSPGRFLIETDQGCQLSGKRVRVPPRIVDVDLRGTFSSREVGESVLELCISILECCSAKLLVPEAS